VRFLAYEFIALALDFAMMSLSAKENTKASSYKTLYT